MIGKKEEDGTKNEMDGDGAVKKVEISLELASSALLQWNEGMKIEVLDPLGKGPFIFLRKSLTNLGVCSCRKI